MKRRMVLIALVVVLLILVGWWIFIPNRSCDSIVKSASDMSVRGYLYKWVDDNVRGRRLDQIAEVDGRSPSVYVVRKPGVSWVLIGFSPLYAEVRVMHNDNCDPIAVYFGQDGRHGIFVSLEGEFGMQNEDLIWRDGRVAVYCADRDRSP